MCFPFRTCVHILLQSARSCRSVCRCNMYKYTLGVSFPSNTFMEMLCALPFYRSEMYVGIGWCIRWFLILHNFELFIRLIKVLIFNVLSLTIFINITR